jgi:hypothetical protein
MLQAVPWYAVLHECYFVVILGASRLSRWIDVHQRSVGISISIDIFGLRTFRDLHREKPTP